MVRKGGSGVVLELPHEAWSGLVPRSMPKLAGGQLTCCLTFCCCCCRLLRAAGVPPVLLRASRRGQPAWRPQPRQGLWQQQGQPRVQLAVLLRRAEPEINTAEQRCLLSRPLCCFVCRLLAGMLSCQYVSSLWLALSAVVVSGVCLPTEGVVPAVQCSGAQLFLQALDGRVLRGVLFWQASVSGRDGL